MVKTAVTWPLFFLRLWVLPITDDEGYSPPPAKMARRLRQEPKISFVFDKTTGDFVESYLTIFLPRTPVPSSQLPNLRHSVHSHVSPVAPNAAYLKAAHGSKPGAKKQRKDLKNRGPAAEVTVPRKHTRDEDEGSQAVDKPATKKLKSKEHKEDEAEGK